jgi:hypothetical protein
MHGPMLATVGEVFFGILGGALALLIIGGGLLLMWQRMRLGHRLMQSAIERGITSFPGVPPVWLISMRQGVTTLALGVALAGFGAVVFGAADRVPMPANGPAMTQPAAMEDQPGDRMPPPPDGPDSHDDMRPMRDHPMDMGPGRRLGPPRMNPAMENWHRAEDRKAVSTIAMGGGFILILLGMVRFLFSFAERKYAKATV